MNTKNSNNVFSLVILSPPPTSTIPERPTETKLKKKKKKKFPKDHSFEDGNILLSVVALKVLTSSINLFVHFLNLGYCDSLSRLDATELSIKEWYIDLQTSQFFPVKSENR